MPRYWAIVPAAGIGRRCHTNIPKQYLPLAKKTVIEHALTPLLSCPVIEKIIIALAENDVRWLTLSISTHPKIITVSGGEERCHSVLNALNALAQHANEQDWILVHDAARPFLRLSDVEKLIMQLADHPVGGLLGIPVYDTLKRVKQESVVETLSRKDVWQALTPQMFRYGILQKALTQLLSHNIQPGDESQAIEALGYCPVMVQGERDNFKITYPSDLQRAKAGRGVTRNMRIGHGYDVHRFRAGDSVKLGGVKIPAEFGIEAHSDGDVIIHAVCDALLGAAALGDIGHHFPDHESENKNRDSREFLRHVVTLLAAAHFRVENIDITVIAQVPKLQPYILTMRQMLAEDLNLSVDRVNIKATTTEGLGYIGEKKGLAVHAVALIKEVENKSCEY